VLVAATLALLTACDADQTGGPADPVAVAASAPAPEDRPACKALLAELPAAVADQESRAVTPSDAWAAAWGDPPIVLTCGVARPHGFDRTSTCTTVNGVDWFLPEEQLDSESPVDLTMTTVNRAEHVEVRLPAEYWPPATALADLSDAVRTTTEKTGSCY
jgi:hypothetical protein